ncbi:trichohyalin-like [Macrobrachium rosenbergii]|uniref:trichohyalin-like n=1 Tax=Macrobrachium rosenbergii TaxID=79674 RepID=UPI0034D76DDD
MPGILDLLELLSGLFICYLCSGGLVSRLTSEDVREEDPFLRQLSERGRSQRMTHKMEMRGKFEADVRDLRSEGRKNSELSQMKTCCCKVENSSDNETACERTAQDCDPTTQRKVPRVTHVIKMFQPQDCGMCEVKQARIALDKESVNLEKEEMSCESASRAKEKEKASTEKEKRALRKEQRAVRKQAKAFREKREALIKEKEKFLKKNAEQLKEDQVKFKKEEEELKKDREVLREAEELLAGRAVLAEERRTLRKHQDRLAHLTEAFALEEEALKKDKEDFAEEVNHYLGDKEDLKLDTEAFTKMLEVQILEKTATERVSYISHDCRRKMEQMEHENYLFDLLENDLKMMWEHANRRRQFNEHEEEDQEIREEVFVLHKNKFNADRRALDFEWELLSEDRAAFFKDKLEQFQRHQEKCISLKKKNLEFADEKRKFNMDK